MKGLWKFLVGAIAGVAGAAIYQIFGKPTLSSEGEPSTIPDPDSIKDMGSTQEVRVK